VSELVDPLSVVAVLPRCRDVLSAAPVLSVALDRVDGSRPFDVAVLLDADLAVFVESLAAEPELDDGPDASADDPLEAGAAQATCWPVTNAAPIPRATASPPTRPTYLAALMVSPSQPLEWSPRQYVRVIKITARWFTSQRLNSVLSVITRRPPSSPCVPRWFRWSPSAAPGLTCIASCHHPSG
jgi:hypothetical protein